MQSVSSRIWTRIAVFISYSDNDYTTGTSKMTVIPIIVGALETTPKYLEKDSATGDPTSKTEMEILAISIRLWIWSQMFE